VEILRRETDYALRALAVLAGARGPVPTSRLADLCDVSLDLTRKIMQKLSKGGIVRADRGTNGGFRLARKPSRVKLAEVVACTQGPLVVNTCVKGAECCCYFPRCPLASRIQVMQKEIDRLTEKTTLADLVTGR